ncbi:cob(I)yrinic acid a,c-diamide adenosyltransferase [Prolixibacteraceae bacterium Z1-6]|uniref:corrinoid adenosyltransferase n=1 Tax=Draconibacterium aestuarii TaxID=2998507 RepID=A0A9X3F1M5_9BACT|nr:cob(I)yrinic acid a,c-diamide adenosyltransferase [Prolixibacteraceae bacterium Z1-6]
MQKGLIHIYTGNGKGKTTASVGLAVRALGHGFRVAYASFFKKPDTYGYNEIGMLKKQGATVFTFSEGMPMANPQISPEEYHASTQQGLSELKKFIAENNTQLLVLDEILIAIKYGYISEDELLEFIENKPLETELVLTGRGATEKIKKKADYITVLSKEKHPYESGVPAREGIEY